MEDLRFLLLKYGGDFRNKTFSDSFRKMIHQLVNRPFEHVDEPITDDEDAEIEANDDRLPAEQPGEEDPEYQPGEIEVVDVDPEDVEGVL